jgi:hypothetical protein
VTLCAVHYGRNRVDHKKDISHEIISTTYNNKLTDFIEVERKITRD